MGVNLSQQIAAITALQLMRSGIERLNPRTGMRRRSAEIIVPNQLGPLRFGRATHFLERPSWATPSMSGLRYSQIPKSAPLSAPSWTSLANWQRTTEELDLRPMSPEYSEACAHIL